MERQAERVYTDPASIQQIETRVQSLPANGHVMLLLQDGSSCAGVFRTRPTVQVFRAADDHEGINATALLERPAAPNGSRHIWLDQIVQVEHLDSAMATES